MIWDAVRNAFRERERVSYWRYPIFSKVGEHRKEPDILIVDQDLGLVIIEVKGLTIDQIKGIAGHRWEFKNFYDYPYDNPYQQAENQLFSLLGFCDNEPSIRRKVTGRTLVALPRITEKQWQRKGFDQLPSCPPIIFRDHLDKETFLELIRLTPPIVSGMTLEDAQWNLLKAVISGTSILRKTPRPLSGNDKNRSGIIAKLSEELHGFDLQQEHIGKTIPPGPQRIRGIGGSGKSVLLCQKAAHMHLKHPEWDIAFVFFTQSLYSQIIDQIDKWLSRFSNGEVKYDPLNSKLRVLHAWGGRSRRSRDGLYSIVCEFNGIRPLTVRDSEERSPPEKLADLCKKVLEEGEIHPQFDAILIDEGQELVVDNRLKFEDKQPIYWLAYQSLRPIDPMHPEQRRLIWAYDEAQSLDNLKIPSAKELFGEGMSKLVSGFHPGGIKKSEIMHRCYRTPGPIIAAAHAMGMGLLRPEGMLSGFTAQRDWRAIGYEIIEGSFIPGQKITLWRPPENSPNPVPELWKGPVLEFEAFESRQEELVALAEGIRYNLQQDQLKPSRDILVVTLGSKYEVKKLQTYAAGYLIKEGIDIYIPSAPKPNSLSFEGIDRKPDIFWWDGAVTISKIFQAKGNEAYVVYVIGLDNIAMDEGNINLRNQLFVALTRTMGWAKLSGVGNYPMYDEIREVIAGGNTFTFKFERPLKRDISKEDEIQDEVQEKSEKKSEPNRIESSPIISQSFLSNLWPFSKK